MAEYSNVRVRPKTKAAADKLAEKYEMNLLDLYSSMVEYFEKTGVNPRDRVILSPAEELKKFRDTIISFMRKQEKDFILPVFSQMNTLAVRFSEYIENEAPKGSEKSSRPSVPTLGQNQPKVLADDTKSQEQSSLKIPQAITESQSEELKNLKADYAMLELKYKTLAEYYTKLVNNIKYKSIGMGKGHVVDLPVADINDFKDYLRRI
jgi:hypothetical protein